MPKPFITALLITVSLAISSWSPVMAVLTAERVKKLVQEAKVLDYPDRLQVQVIDQEVMISTYIDKNSKNEDNDCKIDAILVGKKLMDADPHGIARVTVA